MYEGKIRAELATHPKPPTHCRPNRRPTNGGKDAVYTPIGSSKKAYVLDDYTVQRVIRAYTEQLEFLWVYEKQFAKWKREERLTSSQQSEISRLQKQLEHSRQVLTNILSLAEEMKKGTIEKVMEKSDFNLGIEFLRNIKITD